MKRVTFALACAALASAAFCLAEVRAAAPGGPPAPGGAVAPGGPGGFGGPGGPGAAPGGRGGGRGGARGPAVPPGPPQPVPAAVAMPRPTQDEVTQFNAALAKLIDSDNSASKALLQKYKAMAAIQVPRDNPTIRPVPGVRQGRHDAFVEIAKAGNIDLLLNGDSITDGWRNSTEANTKFFSQYKMANFGVGGDTTQGLLWGLLNGEGQGFQPKAIMLMIGTNSSGNASGPEIAEGVGAVVQNMRTNFPNAKILLLAIFPRNAPNSAGRRVNAEASTIFSKLHDNKNIFYMDIGQHFLQPDGTIATDVMADGLHPTPKGYEIWGNAVKDKLAELMK